MLAIRALASAIAGVAFVQAALAQTTPEAEPPKRPRIGLVLSGGGARGGAHIGVLRVLEAMRVPVDVIAATSAGAIVGGAYASGLSLEEIEREMKGLSAATLFRDVQRDDVPFRRKADDALNYVGPEMGLGPEGLTLPKGVVAGVSMEAVLRNIARRQTTTNFDRLPIRFRAVATDLVTSEVVVLDHGSLALAMRASMAVPAAVNPVNIDGRLLVDGGLKRNLPVDVARQLGADVVIAVNIATPLQTREEITSLVSVSDQMLRILIAENVSRSLAELRPEDVLVTPTLGNISTASFDRLSEAADRGEAAARAMADKLSRYSVSQERYRAYLAQRERKGSDMAQTIDEVRVVGTLAANPEVVKASMQTQAGKKLDVDVIERDIKRIYGRGDFEGVNYELFDDADAGHVLQVDVTEKSWGPNFLRLGLGLSSDFEGNSYFTLRATHRWTWLNALGAEWRNDLQIGRRDRLASEWYQPLTPRQQLFIAPHVETERVPFDVYDEDDGKRLARFRLESTSVGLDLGRPLGTRGEVRLGVLRGQVHLADDTTFVPSNSVVGDARTGGILAQLRIDQFDSARFPRSGYSAELRYYLSRTQLGADQDYGRALGMLSVATAWGPHSLMGSIRAGGHRHGDTLPFYELFTLGGLFQLSGYKTNELIGAEMGLARAIYTYRLANPGVLDGMYVGTSFELGRIGDSAFGNARSGLRRGNSLFFALDTPIGPVYLGVGLADRGNKAAYFYLGEPF